MEWSNAKKFVIVLLVLLNVLLAGLNYKQNRENTMTAAQERSIFEVLSRNGITMYTDLLTEHPPMSRLAVERPPIIRKRWSVCFLAVRAQPLLQRAAKRSIRGNRAA